MPKTSSKGTGKGLKKKLGPFPTYVWVLIGVIAVAGYIYYRKRQSTASNPIAGSLDQQSIPSGVIAPVSGSGATGDNSGGVSSAPTNFPYDYATNSDLQSGLNDLGNTLGAQIASITFPQPADQISQSPIPINVTVTPTPAPTIPHAAVASHTVASKTAAKKAVSKPSHITYFTYKKNVPLKAGQTLHYTKGKGYYAA